MKQNIRQLIRFVVVSATMCFAGCFTMETAKVPGPTGGTHLQAHNSGYYLFHLVPLASGNISEDPSCPFVLFRDDVDMDKMQKRFLNKAAKIGGGTVQDITYAMDDNVITMVPILYVTIPIPYLITSREIQVSGVIR